MPSLKDIKSRIHSVKNTAKITNAMKLVSAAKFAKASQSVSASRPYAMGFDDLVQRMVGSASIEHPLLKTNTSEKVLVAVFSTDRGLCGPLNSNLMKLAATTVQSLQTQGRIVELAAWGRKSRDFSRKSKVVSFSNKEKITEKPNIEAARSMAAELKEAFLEGTFSEIYLIYPKFQSALVQEPQQKRLFPIAVDSNDLQAAMPIVEPDATTIIDKLLHRQVDIQIYQALLETAASEHGSRMTAMDSATNNAKEVIRKLTIQYNRARQAAITTELIEITSGASALAN